MRKSDGSPVSAVDWRANRLADAVAKSAAGAPSSTTHAVRCLKSAGDVLRHEAAVLGAVTCAANTLRVRTITASGNSTTVVKRDSVATVAAPRAGRGHARGAVGHGTYAPSPPDTAAASTPLGATRWRAMRPEGQVVNRVATLATAIARARDERVTMRILDDAAAARGAADAAADVRAAPNLGTLGTDEVGRALVSAHARVHARGCVASPATRHAALCARIAAKEQHAPWAVFN